MKININWDNVKSEDILVVREMLYENPKIILKKYSKEKLKEIFLNYLHLFDKKNLNFWKLVLNIDNDLLNRKTEKSFRKDCQIWNY